jgi:hypothetical protein
MSTTTAKAAAAAAAAANRNERGARRDDRRSKEEKMRADEIEAEAAAAQAREEEREDVANQQETVAVRDIKTFFLSKLKHGLLPSIKDVKQFCVEESIPIPPEAKLRRLRYNWKVAAVLARWSGAKRYQSASIMKPGNLQIDMAHMMPRHANQNKQCKYFLVAKDNLTGCLFCVPCVSKTRDSWQSAILTMIRTSGAYICHLTSDRDAITSGSFRRNLKINFGISWSYLPSRGHAHLAESAIAFYRRRLALAVGFNKRGDFCWIKHVDGITKDQNSKFIKNTSIRRDSVTKENYFSVLEELYNSTDPTMLWNITSGQSFSPWMQRKFWRWKVGDSVLVAREADYTAQGQKTSAFFKRSEKGAWNSKVRKITGLFLKDSKFMLSPCYEISGIKGKIYESETSAVPFSE